MHPNEYFTKIYCINLDRRQDRWATVKARFDRLGIEVERYSAIDKNITGEKGNTALIKTNIKLFSELEFAPFKKIAIFEDDVVFHKDFLKLFIEHVKHIPANYDAWFMGSIISDFDYKWKYLQHDYFVRGDYVYGTHAMSYSVEFCKKFELYLIENLKKNDYPIDCFLSESVTAEKWASINPILCVQDESESDIITSKEPGRGYDKNIYL